MGPNGVTSGLMIRRDQAKDGVFKTINDNTYRIVESAEPVMKTSEFLGCHEHDVNSLTWPLQRKVDKS